MKLSSKPKFTLKPDGSLGWVVPANPFSKIRGLAHSDRLPPIREFVAPPSPYPDLAYNPQSVVGVDWLRCTAVGSDVLFVPAAFQDLLTYDEQGNISSDFVFVSSDKGIHGYPSTIKIMVAVDSGLHGVGTIGYQPDPLSSNCGVMIDLSGQFFTYIKSLDVNFLSRIYQFLAGYGFRISRLDLALDLVGTYCRAESITVPTLLGQASNHDLFKSEHSRNGQSLSISTLGEWSDMVLQKVPVDSYDPSVHSPKGLTFNVGSRKSPNFFRVYEKTKQIIATADLNDDDISLDKWAVRIEHEIKRDKDGSDIPWQIILNPDSFFGVGRPHLTSLFTHYAKFLDSSYRFERLHRERFKRNASISLRAKIFWGKRSYGRVIKTLLNEGLGHYEVIDLLSRSTGLKDFVFDIFDIPLNEISNTWSPEDLTPDELSFLDSLCNDSEVDYEYHYGLKCY